MKTRIYFLDNLRTFLIFLVVLYHAGFTYQSAMEANWIVVDTARSDSIGLVGLYLDIFIMAAMFFISGYFIPISLRNNSPWDYVKSKFKRIMIPWMVAVITLIPIYKILFLYSRGLPQQEWYSYFHWFERAGTGLGNFANNPSQHWLWFLPILFLFHMIYLGLAKTKIFNLTISLKQAVILTFFIGVVYSMTIAILDLKGWILTPVLDFQRERLLVYFTFFLLGTLCYKLKVFDTNQNQKKYMILSNVVLTIALSVYTVVAINFLLNMVYATRNYFFVSQRIDGIAYYSSLMLSMLSILYILIHVFKTYFNKTNSIMTQLNKNSYYVYIIHMVVLAVIALVLVNFSLPVGVKYILLALLTFIASNVLVSAYHRTVAKRPLLKIAVASTFIIGFFVITSSGGKEVSPTENKSAISSQPALPAQEIGLHEAVIKGELAAVKEHIKTGSNLNIKEPSGGSSPLITAAVFGKTEIAIALIEAGAEVNLKNNEGSTALHSASFFCHTEIVQALLANGADKTIKNNAGSTALDSVIGPFESVKAIYDYFSSTLGPLGLVLDQREIKETRPVIAEMLEQDT